MPAWRTRPAGQIGLMCLSCGCGQPNESHGNPDHITQEHLEKAATAAGITPAEVAENIQSAVGSG